MSTSGIGPEELCESLSGDYCEPVEIDFPKWLQVDEDTAVIGYMVGVVYLDTQNKLWRHTFEAGAPVMIGKGNAFVTIGPFEHTDGGFEDGDS
jgi:hypothetical protein